MRSFTSFAQAAWEAGRSRIYGGIHFQFDSIAGLATGRALGNYVLGIVSTFLFTMLGIVSAVVLVLNRPADLSDREGIWTSLMVLLPTAGGLVAGLVVGIIAASFAPSLPPRQ